MPKFNFHGVEPNTRLKLILLRQAMTQRELANRAGLNENYIGQYIHGKYNFSTAEKARIAEALEMPLSEVFD